MTRTKKMIVAAFFIAFSVVLPVIFHFFGVLGSVFLPMHIPVLLAGLLLGAKSGMAVGFVAPVLSSLLTGMPPMVPFLPIMMIELLVYGGCSGYLYQKRHCPLLWALVIAMFAGRLAAMLVVALMVTLLHFSLQPFAYIIGAIITGLPGIFIQLIIIPFLLRCLDRVGKQQKGVIFFGN